MRVGASRIISPRSAISMPTSPRARGKNTRESRPGATVRKPPVMATSTTSSGRAPTRSRSPARRSPSIHPSRRAAPLRRTQNQILSPGTGGDFNAARFRRTACLRGARDLPEST